MDGLGPFRAVPGYDHADDYDYDDAADDLFWSLGDVHNLPVNGHWVMRNQDCEEYSKIEK